MTDHDQLNAKFSIGEVSKLTGVNIETIRYYERENILPPPFRTTGGHRVYSDEQLRRLQFVKRSRELGFTLAEIRDLLVLVDGGDYTCAEVKVLTLDHAAEVRRKIVDLERMERVLREMASRCEGDQIPECPIVDALFNPTA